MLKTLTAELDRGECLTMRPRLHALVTEQLRTVQQQIQWCGVQQTTG
jgi:hypothetical protein